MAETKEIKTLKEEFSELKNVVNHSNKNLDRILFLLNNDEGTGRTGLVADVRNLDKDVKEVKKKWMIISRLEKFPMPSTRVKSPLLAWLAGFFGLLSHS